MIVSPQEYNGLLHQLRDPNEFSNFIRIPSDERVYEINLNERTISAPNFLSVASDMNAEIIWFKVDRFYDNIDLFSGACWILYTNANGKSYYYNAPMQVVAGEYGSDYLIVPWVVSKEAAAASGDIIFSFQFFKLSEDYQKFLYIVNTQPAKSKILVGSNIDIEETATEDIENAVNADNIIDQLKVLSAAFTALTKDYEVYWLEA